MPPSREEHSYLLDNRADPARQRFTGLEATFDANSRRHLQALGLDRGWRCLEVGAGSGSIARWLAERVGPTGSVLATDLDPRWASTPDLPQLEIRRHDIRRDPLPDAAFDLVHERLVLTHLPDPAEVLRRLRRSLRPGAWLVAEDFHSDLVSPGDLDVRRDGDADAFELLKAYRRGLVSLFEAAGGDPRLGRRLPELLDGAGFDEVGADGYIAIAPGSGMGRVDASNVRQLRMPLVTAGHLTDGQVEALIRALEEGTVTPASPVLVTAWGRRTAEA